MNMDQKLTAMQLELRQECARLLLSNEDAINCETAATLLSVAQVISATRVELEEQGVDQDEWGGLPAAPIETAEVNETAIPMRLDIHALWAFLETYRSRADAAFTIGADSVGHPIFQILNRDGYVLDALHLPPAT